VPLFNAQTDPASRRAAHPLGRLVMYLGGPLFTGLTSLGIPSMDAPQEFHGPRRCLSVRVSGSYRGQWLNVYDRAVICVGPGGNYAGSRTIANDPKERISQPLRQWAVTIVGAKKPRPFSAVTASSTLPTAPRNTHPRTHDRQLTALVMLQGSFCHCSYRLLG
jgi:hypothetical protein